MREYGDPSVPDAEPLCANFCTQLLSVTLQSTFWFWNLPREWHISAAAKGMSWTKSGIGTLKVLNDPIPDVF